MFVDLLIYVLTNYINFFLLLMQFIVFVHTFSSIFFYVFFFSYNFKFTFTCYFSIKKVFTISIEDFIDYLFKFFISSLGEHFWLLKFHYIRMCCMPCSLFNHQKNTSKIVIILKLFSWYLQFINMIFMILNI